MWPEATASAQDSEMPVKPHSARIFRQVSKHWELQHAKELGACVLSMPARDMSRLWHFRSLSAT
eukprot:3473274-Alexandrium_andersonii.AAC.1